MRTNKQEMEALRAVALFWEAHGHAPAMRDIQRWLGLSSSSLAMYRLKPLLDKGLLARCERCADLTCRTIFVTPAGQKWLSAAMLPRAGSPPGDLPVPIPAPPGGA